MKIGLVFTGVTPTLEENLRREIDARLGTGVEYFCVADPSVLADIRAAGRVYAQPAARLISMYMRAIGEGCDAILNVCSSVGDVADTMRDVSRLIGVPIVRVDEDMCREAVRIGERVVVAATLRSTLDPTRNTLLRVASEAGRRVELVDCLVDGGFGKSGDDFCAEMIDRLRAVSNGADVILFAQASMADCERAVGEAFGVPVLSSPRFGAAALASALASVGVLSQRRENV